MGQNTKFLMGFNSRFWEDAALGPTVTEDGPVNLTWETTEANRIGKIGMVAFSGANNAKTLSKSSVRAVKNKILGRLQPVYQYIKTRLRRHEFVNWPKDPWTNASYCFPKPGDVTYWGPIYKAGFQNRFFFAGEHTSWAFMGYMEGALSSGYRVAARIALRDAIGIS
jgi:monoamine oxidase